jgi:hypothetical protein
MASNEQFYNRMRQIAGIKPVNESTKETNARTLVDTEKANNGTVYGIVKENHHYFIKKAYVTEGEAKVTDFTYIDGVENKGNYQYNTLAEAEKQRNFYVKGINEAFDQGGVYFVNETKENEAPSLDTNEDFSSLVKRTISEGKKNLAENREKKFKAALPENSDEGAGARSRRGLMPESADLAVKKALGLLVEEAPFTEKPKGEGDEVTADSEIKDGDVVSQKSGKESPQAPINDSNAKAHAEKATGTSKKDANKKPAASDSLAVNQEDDVLKEEASPLVTDDSEIITNDSMANKVGQKHESPQAPINDGNAKAEADKAMATGGASEDSAMPNQNKEEQKESDPFDDKEDKGDEKGDIVTEDADKGDPFDDKAKVQGGGDEVTADSDEKDADRVDNETKVEKADADYNNHNQPEVGHKEHKGEPSVQKESDPFDDKTKAGAEKGDIVAEQAANALGNLLGEGVENEVAEQPESDPFDDKENAGDEKGDIVTEDEDQPFDSSDKAKAGAEKGDIVAEGDVDDAMADDKAKDAAMKDMKDDGEPVVEGKDLSTADSEINADESPANMKSNVTYNNPPTKSGVSEKMNDNAIAEADAKEQPESDPFDDKEKAGDEKGDIVAENLDEAGEEEIEAAADAVGDLDAAADAEDAAEEVPAMDAEAAPEGGEEVAMDAEVDAEAAPEGGEEAPAEGGADDLVVKEIEKLVGKTTQKIRNTELEPETAEGFLKSIVSSFEDKLPEIDLDGRKEVADDVLDPEKGVDTEVDAEVEVDAEAGGEPSDAEVGGGEFDNIEADVADSEVPAEEPAMEEDAPMQVDGEDFVDGEELPTFETYMESRGYSPDNLGECSVSEMGNLVSGYLADKGELEEGEIEGVAKYMNNEVCEELVEYGHGDFAEKAKPFIKEGGVSFGMTEPTLPEIEMEEGKAEDMDGDGDIDSDDYMAKKDAAIKDAMKNEDEEEIEISDDSEEEEAPEVGFGEPAEIMGGGVVKPDGAATKSVEVDLNSGTLKMEVSENSKVQKYIKNKLEELAGKRKPSMNESSKSENLKKLDRLIEQQWKEAAIKMTGK